MLASPSAGGRTSGVPVADAPAGGERCRGYVKMVSTLSALPPLRTRVADAATPHLDLVAAERGYTNHS